MREQHKDDDTERWNTYMSRWRVLAILLGPSLLLLVIATGVASMIALLFR